MDLRQLQQFLQLCLILNVGFLLLWTVAFRFAPDFVYRQQRKWFTLTREAFDEANYRLLGTFKILVIVLTVVPYLALLLMQR